jgi:cell fate (sporulation/competence/biofilm development) regulator YlbF (YheA/YmcA/DUF963 family)
MEEEIKGIVREAVILSDMIRRHPLAVEYQKNLARMNGDPESRRLLARLVALGKDLHDMADRSEEMVTRQSPENMELELALRSNSLVKEFIASERGYFGLLAAVHNRIAHPEKE